MLDASDVERIQKILPDVKVIYIIRNPIDRVWSQVRRKGLDFSDVEQLRAAVNHRNVREKTNYLETIRKWQPAFGDNFYLTFFDDFLDDPEAFFAKICEFLGIRFDADVLGRTEKRVVNAAPRHQIPAIIKKELAQEYLPMVRQLAREFGNAPLRWQEDLEAIAKRETP